MGEVSTVRGLGIALDMVMVAVGDLDLGDDADGGGPFLVTWIA